jgi:hypothetical protein
MLPVMLPAANRGAVAFPADPAGILKVLETQAVQTATEAGELASISRFDNASLQTHSIELDAVKDHLNAMAVTMARLESVRDSEDAIQRAAADRATHLLQQMADDTRVAIAMLNTDGSSFWRPRYEQHIRNLESASRQLAGSLKEVVQLASVRNREKHLEKDLSTVSGF